MSDPISAVPNSAGRFGEFGGRYVPETLTRALDELAAEYEIPALVHVDAGSEKAIVNICSRHPAVNILFAHAGGNLRPKHVEAVIEKCPRILIELSARDPWRYGRLTDDNGKLLPKWRDVIVRYPHRFVVGTDPVWRVTRTQSWDEIDDAWR